MAGALEGCSFVLHVASPLPTGHVENEDDVIITDRDGSKARRVLDWEPRTAETSVIETGHSFVAAGLATYQAHVHATC